ncbi:hypothetical protein [Sharpea azabuensis]|uniref:hypothetical protein n=1 Tax=Sharpea azabuensis TaxID=322505 RepID=UPI00338DAF48
MEESYTSKFSYWGKAAIPAYNADNPREYQCTSGKTFNADVNGALNVMRKSSVVDMNIIRKWIRL